MREDAKENVRQEVVLKNVNVDNANFRDLTSQSGLKQKLQVKHLPP